MMLTGRPASARKALERGLVDDNFSFNYSSDTSYAFALAGGETDDVPRLRRALDGLAGGPPQDLAHHSP